MTTSRTGTTHWRNLRTRAIHRAKTNGITNCPECNQPLDYTTTRQPNSPEPDHITPHANGGKDTLTNLRIICRWCNQSKGNRQTPTPTNRNPIPTSRNW